VVGSCPPAPGVEIYPNVPKPSIVLMKNGPISMFEAGAVFEEGGERPKGFAIRNACLTVIYSP
jgi:hypothetical protein